MLRIPFKLAQHITYMEYRKRIVDYIFFVSLDRAWCFVFLLLKSIFNLAALAVTNANFEHTLAILLVKNEKN